MSSGSEYIVMRNRHKQAQQSLPAVRESLRFHGVELRTRSDRSWRKVRWDFWSGGVLLLSYYPTQSTAFAAPGHWVTCRSPQQAIRRVRQVKGCLERGIDPWPPPVPLGGLCNPLGQLAPDGAAVLGSQEL